MKAEKEDSLALRRLEPQAGHSGFTVVLVYSGLIVKEMGSVDCE